MLRSNWGIILAIVVGLVGAALLWVALVPVMPVLPTYEYEQPRPHQETSPGGCQPKVLAAIADRGKALRERERCAKDAEDYRLQTNDLIQQTRAANAAEAQALLAHQAGVVSVLQTIGGFLTLLAAAAAAWYARRAAIHTEAGAVSARDAVNANRAWVLFQGVGHGQMSGKLDGKPVNDGFLFDLRVRNYGGSPAIEVALSRDFAVIPFGWDPPPDLHTEDPIPGTGIIGPNDDASPNRIVLNDDEARSFRQRKSKVLLFLKVRYRDVINGAMHASDYRLLAEHGGGREKGPDGDKEHVIISMIGSTNPT